MNYRIQLTDGARETVSHLSPELKKAVKEGFRFLSSEPRGRSPLVRELLGKWKLRIGRYRIVYKIRPEYKSVIVLAVGHRRDIYEKLRATPVRSPRSHCAFP